MAQYNQTRSLPFNKAKENKAQGKSVEAVHDQPATRLSAGRSQVTLFPHVISTRASLYICILGESRDIRYTDLSTYMPVD
jgi:hypothetical protein